MPFKSKAQQRAMYAKANAGEIDKKVVDEFSEATKKMPGGFKSLPEKAKKKKTKKAEITLDVEKGDTVLMGRFKNSPQIVKTIGTDSLGQPTINGRKALTFRIKKLMPEKDQLSSEKKSAVKGIKSTTRGSAFRSLLSKKSRSNRVRNPGALAKAIALASSGVSKKANYSILSMLAELV